eukprot:4379705-Prymnesium_polylepis.2
MAPQVVLTIDLDGAGPRPHREGLLGRILLQQLGHEIGHTVDIHTRHPGSPRRSHRARVCRAQRARDGRWRPAHRAQSCAGPTRCVCEGLCRADALCMWARDRAHNRRSAAAIAPSPALRPRSPPSHSGCPARGRTHKTATFGI